MARLLVRGAQQVGQRGVGAVQEPEDVQLDHLLPLGQWRIDNGAEQHHTGVVDQRVETAELADRAGDGIRRLAFVGDVALQHQCRAARRADRGRDLFEAVLSARHECHRGAVRGERN